MQHPAEGDNFAPVFPFSRLHLPVQNGRLLSQRSVERYFETRPPFFIASAKD
jgi:hypothetical protein